MGKYCKWKKTDFTEVAILERYNFLFRVTLIPTLFGDAIAAFASAVVPLPLHALLKTSKLSRVLNISFITSGTQKLPHITFAQTAEL